MLTLRLRYNRYLFIFSCILFIGYFLPLCQEFLPFLKAFCGYLLAFFFPGLLFYFLGLDTDSNLIGFIAIPLAISPYLFSLATCLLMLAGLGIETAISATIIIFQIALWIYLSFWLGQLTFHFERAYVYILAFALVFTLLVLIPQATNIYTKLRSDGLLHTGIVLEIMKGHIPPSNPFFAEEKLGYYWFYHLFIAVICQVTSLQSYNAMALANIHAIFVLVLIMYVLSSYFKKKFSHRFFPVFLLIFGLNTLGWLFLLMKIFKGELTWKGATHGGVIRILGALSYNFDLRVAAIVSKFMVLNPFPWGLMPICLFLYYFFKYLNSKKVIFGILCSISLSEIIYFHVVSGTYVLGITSITLLAVFLQFILSKIIFSKKFSHVDNIRINKKTILNIILFSGITMLFILPYLVTISTARSTPQSFTLSLSMKNYKTLLFCLPLPLFLFFFSIKETLKSAAFNDRILIIWTGACLFTLPFFKLNGGNEYKLFYILLIPLALLSGWTIANLLERCKNYFPTKIAYISVLIVVFIPTNLITIYAYINQPSELYMSEDECSTYKWIKENTSDSSVFIENISQGYSLLPVFTQQRLFMGNLPWLEQWGIHRGKIKSRIELVRKLFNNSNPVKTIQEFKALVHDPLYVIVKKKDLVQFPKSVLEFGNDKKNFRKVYENNTVWIFALINGS